MNNGVKNRYLRMNGWLEFNYVGKEVYKSQDASDPRLFDVETALGMQLYEDLKDWKEPTQ